MQIYCRGDFKKEIWKSIVLFGYFYNKEKKTKTKRKKGDSFTLFIESKNAEVFFEDQRNIQRSNLTIRKKNRVNAFIEFCMSYE